MKILQVLLLCALHAFLAASALAQEQSSHDLSDREVRILYGQFKEIKTFGLISVALVGDAERAGLVESDLVRYVKLQFDKDFCGIGFDDLSTTPNELMKMISSRDKQVGTITFRAWVIGEDYPLAYHVRGDAGNFNNTSIWSEEVLGHGSKDNLVKLIKDILSEMMRDLAESFRRARGEECR